MKIEPLTATIGAEIGGVDLASPLPDPATATEGVFAERWEPLGDGQAPWSRWDESAWKEIEIAGDTDVAATINHLSRHLRWDIEEDLSRVFGDIAAHRMTQAGRSAATWSKQAATGLAGNVAEFLTEEKHLLVTPLRAAEFVRDVDELRDAVERLDKRIERLQRQVRGG